MAEIDRLMAELQAQKNFSAIRGRANSARELCEPHLDNFGLRKNHFDTVSGWREASHPMPEFEIMRSPAKDSTGRMERPID